MCPNSWEQRPESPDCYLITYVTDMRTRDDTSAECQKQQGHLVKVDSIQERDWLRQKMEYLRQTQGQFHFWVGLSNRPGTGNTGFKWEDQTYLDTSILPWMQGQPDNAFSGEHCGELWNGELNDNDCNQHYPYICEIPKFQPYVGPQLPGNQVINGIVFSTSCLGQTVDCSTLPAGNYQSCQGCHFYMTCAPAGIFVRSCPDMLVWDDNIKNCQVTSSTCGPVSV